MCVDGREGDGGPRRRSDAGPRRGKSRSEGTSRAAFIGKLFSRVNRQQRTAGDVATGTTEVPRRSPPCSGRDSRPGWKTDGQRRVRESRNGGGGFCEDG